MGALAPTVRWTPEDDLLLKNAVEVTLTHQIDVSLLTVGCLLVMILLTCCLRLLRLWFDLHVSSLTKKLYN